MQVSPINNVIFSKQVSFCKRNPVTSPIVPQISNEDKIEKTKKALSKCRTVIFGLALLYIGIKRVSRYEQAINSEKIRQAIDELHIS